MAQNGKVRDMDSRIIRLPRRSEDCVRIAPGTDFANRRATLASHDPRPGNVTDLLRGVERGGRNRDRLIGILIMVAVAGVFWTAVLGMAGAL